MAALAVAFGALSAGAQESPPGDLRALPAWAQSAPGEFRAVRRASPIHLDGKLDEPAWSFAPAYSDFTESFPREGAPPSMRTEVRVLYDHQNLYVGIQCFDEHPELINRQLGRRDTAPTADWVTVIIDSSHDRRTAYEFSINAAGVLRDALWFEDVNSADTWDAVWDGAAAVGPNGWSAELVIPLNILRFSAAPEQTWGFWVQRNVPRTHQLFDSALIPHNVNAKVSRFGELKGLKDLAPRPDLELTPYAAGRVALAPRYMDPGRPYPRLLSPLGDVGTDVRASLTSSLVLNAAINPDFGQVEADQIILNLQNFEPFFPEKRPFFTEGLDLFQPVGAEFGAPNRLFYSRRIGLAAPILGSAKVTGSVRTGLEVGVLDAVVMGANDPTLGPYAYTGQSLDSTAYYQRLDAAPLDRRLQFHPSEPFHLELNNQLPAIRPVTTNYFGLVARQQVSGASTVGATLTSAAPWAPACFPSDFRQPQGAPPVPPGESLTTYSRDGCSAAGQNAVGLDWNLRSADGQYAFLGVLDGTQLVGGPSAGTQFLDGNYLRPGDLGYGGYAYAGKFGGEPWRFDLEYQYASPREDFNQEGYLPSQNQQRVGGNLHYVRPTGFGRLRSFSVNAWENSYFTTDGRGVSRGNYAGANVNAMLPGYQNLGLSAVWENPRFDVREIHYAGIPMERQGDFNVSAWAGSDSSRALYVAGDVFLYRLLGKGYAPYADGYGSDASLVWRPESKLETQLQASYTSTPQGLRYVASLGQDQYAFGAQRAGFFSVTLRQLFVIDPKITLQAYAQFFSDYGRYGPFYAAQSSPGHVVLLSDMQPFDYAASGSPSPDFHDTALNLNVVFRWEYRLGSILYLVYTRSQSALPGNAPPANVLPYQLGRGPATDTFLVKWSYWWSA